MISNTLQRCCVLLGLIVFTSSTSSTSPLGMGCLAAFLAVPFLKKPSLLVNVNVQVQVQVQQQSQESNRFASPFASSSPTSLSRLSTGTTTTGRSRWLTYRRVHEQDLQEAQHKHKHKQQRQPQLKQRQRQNEDDAEAEADADADNNSKNNCNVKPQPQPRPQSQSYEWPDLYSEAEEMILASYTSYPITILRREAMKGNLKNNEKVLTLLGMDPGSSTASGNSNNNSNSNSNGSISNGRCMAAALSVSDLVDMVEENMEYLLSKKYFLDEERSFGAINALQTIANNAMQAGSRRMIILEEFNAIEEESRLVYGIAINHSRRRITIIFRGTYPEGTNDWKRNFQFDMKTCPTPDILLEGAPSVPRTFRVHRGFYEYLVDNYREQRGLTVGNAKPTFFASTERHEDILNDLIPLLQLHPDYKIYVTGHSLGGSLGTLKAMYLASLENIAKELGGIVEIPKPITCVTVGAPLVGDHDFQLVHQRLEQLGWIRHLRVTNHNDIIPFGWPFTLDGQLYRHVGVHLELWPEKAELRYKRQGQLRDNTIYFPRFTLNPVLQHGVSEYVRRIVLHKQSLRATKLSLDDIYDKVKHVDEWNATFPLAANASVTLETCEAPQSLDQDPVG